MRRKSPRRKRDAMAVEEFENLDGDLAAVVEPVAKLRRGELAVGAVAATSTMMLDHLRDGAAQEEMVVRDLIDLPHAAEQLQQPAHVALASAEHRRRYRAPAAAESVRLRRGAARSAPRAFRPPA